jgi:hypothetical protein
MQLAGVRRIVVVGAAPVGTVPSPARPEPPKHDPGDGFIMRNLDWTVVRPVRLTVKPVTGTYRITFGHHVRHGLFISRADIAHCLLRALDRPETIGQTVGIAN